MPDTTLQVPEVKQVVLTDPAKPAEQLLLQMLPAVLLQLTGQPMLPVGAAGSGPLQTTAHNSKERHQSVTWPSGSLWMQILVTGGSGASYFFVCQAHSLFQTSSLAM